MKTALFLLTFLTATLVQAGFNSNSYRLEINIDTTFEVVDTMPLYPGCENEASFEEKNHCTNMKIFQFIAKETKYPASALNNKLEGTVYIQYIVNEKGNITEVEILRGVSGAKQLDEEAVRVISSLPRMSPAIQKGKNVRVQYTVPIKFNLGRKKKRKKSKKG